MEGKLPEKAGEMAIDRMYADNNKISVGDTLKSGSQKWKVTGFVALSDYSCLFQTIMTACLMQSNSGYRL